MFCTDEFMNDMYFDCCDDCPSNSCNLQEIEDVEICEGKPCRIGIVRSSNYDYEDEGMTAEEIEAQVNEMEEQISMWYEKLNNGESINEELDEWSWSRQFSAWEEEIESNSMTSEDFALWGKTVKKWIELKQKARK